ncbi:transposase [uncultured Bacteroides sp.]|uniref:transposase n=1 Tax=uncultured Bacteroides sp. TaxID=162156 RepID=UPI0025DD1AB0|nr:transposase [uncultured Bacteroides sp.]
MFRKSALDNNFVLNHTETLSDFFENRLTNAAAESFNAKLKSFRNTFRGVDDVRFYLYRVMMLYA